MSKNLFMMIASGLGMIYLVINFIGNIQKEDDSFKNSAYIEAHRYDIYKKVDSIGQSILDLTEAPQSIQVSAWNSSKFKDKFITLFPDFDEMRHYVKDRLRGKFIQDKLNKQINEVESKFVSGSIDAEGAKRELSTLK